MINFTNDEALYVVIFSVVVSIFGTFFSFYLIKQNQQHKVYIRFSNMRLAYERRIHELERKMSSNPASWKEMNHLITPKNGDDSDSIGADPDALKIDLERHRFLRNLGITSDDFRISSDLVFLLTPFHPDFARITSTIKEATHRVGWRCYRGDEENVTGDLIPMIVKYILRARVVVCVVDGRNPNVLYELGIAHILNKDVILIASNLDQSNSLADIKSKRIIIYDDYEDLDRQYMEALVRILKMSDRFKEIGN